MSPSLQLDSLRLGSGEAEIHPGDRVYSTGDGGILPSDLPIGMVMGDANNWRAGLFADPDLSDYVQIVDYRAALDPPDDNNEIPISLRPRDQNSVSGTAENIGDVTGENLLAGEVILQ